MTATVSVVIPNWNGISYLPECLAALRRQTVKDFEVIVIDNGSTDGSVAFIEEEHSWVKLIELRENAGFAAACNMGIRLAEGSYIALLNNDTEVAPGWLGALVAAAERDGTIGMVASKILLDPASREIDSVGMLLYPDGIGRQRGRGERDSGSYETEEEVFYPSACAALYRSSLLKEIGLLDEDFFAYVEDTDLGLRARLAGAKAVLAPAAVVHHKYSGTGGKYSTFKAFHVERNRIWVAVKNFPLSWLMKVPFYTLLRYGVQLYGALSGKGSTARFRETTPVKEMAMTVAKAYLSAFRGLPRMLKKRREIKRNISNAEFSALLKRYRISVSELVLKD